MGWCRLYMLRPGQHFTHGMLQDGGERLMRDRIGGDLLFTLLAQLRFPLPVPAMQAVGMYGHVFANAGNLVQLTGASQSLEQSFRGFGRGFRWSAVRPLSLWLSPYSGCLCNEPL